MNEDEFDDDVDSEVIHQLWESVDEEYLEFKSIPLEDRPFSSPDLCAFALLDKKFPTEREQDMVSAAEHDQIWLRLSDTQVAQLTKDEVLYLTRCGVSFDSDICGLYMFT
jgi:hypothetical protein